MFVQVRDQAFPAVEPPGGAHSRANVWNRVTARADEAFKGQKPPRSGAVACARSVFPGRNERQPSGTITEPTTKNGG